MKKYFLIGIGGISMSAIATLLKSYGNFVCGYDISENDQVKSLRGKGINISNAADDFKLLNACDVVCYSHAIQKDNPLLKQAISLKKCVLTREKMLQIISKNYDTVIAVSGCHGKSSTTGIISYILNECNRYPTMHLGAELSGYDTNVLTGFDKLFITEACEYKRSFLSLNPNISIIMNIEYDHADCYNTIDELIDVFGRFKSQTSDLCIINGDCKNCKSIIDPNAVTFGLGKTNKCYAEKIKRGIDYYEFSIVFNGKTIENVKTKLLGEHNVYNILASYVVLNYLGVSDLEFKETLSRYSGIKRRLEKIKTVNGCQIICDYAHHPTEIENTLKLLKQFTKGAVYCVFQPHTYTRTKSLLSGFCEKLGIADKVFLTPIYPAREKPIEGIDSQLIVSGINNLGGNAELIEIKENIPKILLSQIKEGDCVAVLGAGDINSICKLF